MGSIADLDSLYSLAVAADAAEDYAAAARHARAILARLATSPNVTRATGGGSQSGSQGITHPGGETIQAFLDRVSKLAKASTVASGGPFVQSKVTYARATDG